MTKTYFVTASAYMHQNLFQRRETADLLLAMVVRNRDKGEFLLHEYMIMPNHMHLLVTVDDDHSIGRAMQLIKGGFSHAIGKAGLKLKAVWQPSYYEHRVRDDSEYERIKAYARILCAGIWPTALRITRTRPQDRRLFWTRCPRG